MTLSAWVMFRNYVNELSASHDATIALVEEVGTVRNAVADPGRVAALGYYSGRPADVFSECALNANQPGCFGTFG